MKDPTEWRNLVKRYKETGKLPWKAGKRLSDEEYVSTMEKVAANNWQKWGDESEDAALTRILNNNEYDYRGYYDENPDSKANADTHWTDKYKTVYHPTFSTESKYSGKKSQYNPNGLPGGTWNGEFFNPQWYQQSPHSSGFYKDGYPRLPRFATGTEGDIPEWLRKKLEGQTTERTDNTAVQRQEVVQPIKHEYGKVVDPSLVERQQQRQPVVKQGNTYKVKPRPQTFAGRVTQAVGGDWVKADMTSAGVSQIPVVGTLNGALDFGYDLNNSAHNTLDLEANTNTAMSGLALLPYLRNGLKMLKGKTFIDRLRNTYESAMTKYNTSKEVNKALKTAKYADAVEDGTAGIMDQYAKDWFNNETTFFKPYISHGSTGNTVGDVIDFNLGMYGGRDKLISELTPNQQWSLIKAVTMAEGNLSPRMRKIIHMDDSGPQPVNKIGLVPKDATNSNSSWTSSLAGEPEIWWNRAEPYYNPFGYSSIKSIPRTYVADMDNLINSGITLEGKKVLHGPGVVPFETIDYAIQPNPFGWFDRVKFK